MTHDLCYMYIYIFSFFLLIILDIYIYIFFIVLQVITLLSAHIERFSVSRIQHIIFCIMTQFLVIFEYNGINIKIHHYLTVFLATYIVLFQNISKLIFLCQMTWLILLDTTHSHWYKLHAWFKIYGTEIY